MRNFLINLFLADEANAWDDIKQIADKIIPDDPWAFVVQISATFILILILAKFLVKPVKKYMEERQAYIQNNLDDANTKNELATSLLDEANLKLKNAKVTSKEMIDDAKITASNHKEKIIEETKKEVDALKEKAHQDIENERILMKKQLEKEIVDVALLAAGKVVEREITKEDNERIINSFIDDGDEE